MLADAHQMTIPDLVEENARRFADRTALVGESAEQRITFSELPGRMCALAAGLRAAGVRRGNCVASLGMNSVAVFEAFLATSALGAVFAPLNWRQTDEELQRYLRTAQASFTLFDPEWAHLAEGPGHAYEALSELRSPEADGAVVEAQEGDPALRLLTAAFTGAPHAADLSQRGLLSISVQQIIVHQIRHDEVFLNSGPMFHVGDWIFALPVFQMGGVNVIPRKYDPDQAAEIVAREGVTWAYLVPPMGGQLLDAAEAAGHSLTTIRKGVAVDDRDRWYEKTSATPQADVMPYGQTEVCGLATYQVSHPGGSADFGMTLPLVRAAILDPAGNEVPPGETGQIALRGPTVMIGYADDAEATRARFQNGWYLTGDLGRRRPDGGVQFVGPMNEIIKSGAENIYPAEVEAALSRHDSVAGVCVIGVPDETWGASVRAIVVARDGAEIEAGELIAFCREQIASYKKPREVVVVDELPRQGYAIDRRAVHQRWGGTVLAEGEAGSRATSRLL
jgi:long-chain acyl-CoA synthetase